MSIQSTKKILAALREQREQTLRKTAQAVVFISKGNVYSYDGDAVKKLNEQVARWETH